MSAADFDAWLQEHPSDDVPAAFADWLAQATGDTVIGKRVDGDDVIVAAADDRD